MKMMLRMAAVGAMLIGANGLAHATPWSDNDGCPGDGYGVLTLYDSAGNSDTICLPSGTASASYDLTTLQYRTGTLDGRFPLYSTWSGNIASFSMTAGDGYHWYNATFSVPHSPSNFGCSEEYSQNVSKETASSCVHAATGLELEEVYDPIT